MRTDVEHAGTGPARQDDAPSGAKRRGSLEGRHAGTGWIFAVDMLLADCGARSAAVYWVQPKSRIRIIALADEGYSGAEFRCADRVRKGSCRAAWRSPAASCGGGGRGGAYSIGSSGASLVTITSWTWLSCSPAEVMRTKRAFSRSSARLRGPAVSHARAQTAEQLMDAAGQAAAVGNAAFDALGHELARILDVGLEVAVRAALAHGAHRAHAAVDLVGAPLEEHHLTGSLVGPREERARA